MEMKKDGFTTSAVASLVSITVSFAQASNFL
jgi:hypothetical protein